MDRCECGNELKYYESLDEYLSDEKTFNLNKEYNLSDIISLWDKQRIEIKMIPVVAISLILTLIIAFSGALNVFEVSYAEVIPADIKNAHKPIIVDISASWCSACQHFEQDTLSDPRVQEKINEYYVLLKIDIDQNRDLAEEFDMDVVPTIVLLDADCKQIGRHEGYIGPDEFLTML